MASLLAKMITDSAFAELTTKYGGGIPAKALFIIYDVIKEELTDSELNRINQILVNMVSANKDQFGNRLPEDIGDFLSRLAKESV